MKAESAFNHKQTVQDYTSFMAHRIFITGDDEQARQKAAGLLNARLYVELTEKSFFFFFPSNWTSFYRIY